MGKAENPAQTISFYWTPLVYPVRWADSPEEVPEWDMSRGCHWSEWKSGDNSPRHPLIHPTKYPKWDVKPPPKDGYPRLVRYSLKDRVTEVSRAQDDVLGEIAPLYAYIDKPVAKMGKDVLKLATKYGAVSENTLEAWLALSAFVRTHKWALYLLQANSGDFDLTRDELQMQREALEQKRGMLTFGVSYYGGLNKIDGQKLRALVILCACGRKVKRVETFRLTVAKHLYSGLFGEQLGFGKDEHVAFREFGVKVRCSVSTWVHYKLAELWRHGAEVRMCAFSGCGMLFAPTRTNVKYCKRGTCAYKAHKQNQKARAAQP